MPSSNILPPEILRVQGETEGVLWCSVLLKWRLPKVISDTPAGVDHKLENAPLVK